MSQSGITDPSRQTQWSEWYAEHLRIMNTVEGIDSAVRFQTTSPGWPPSLAMYSIRSPEVFQDPYYLKIRGMGPWVSLIEKRFYQRNLFDAIDPLLRPLNAPSVPPDSALIVTDQEHPNFKLDGIDFLWLESVGLDQSIPYRGIAVATKEQATTLTHYSEIAIYQ